MRKAERLFQLVTLLQGRRTAMTAHALAEALEVSLRTVYRDVQALILSGVPIDGEAGVGYRLRPGFDLPPLMFRADEITSLLVGSRMVQAWTDPALAEAARCAEAKILAVLTPAMRIKISRLPYRIPVFSTGEREGHGILRAACETRQKVEVTYRDLKDHVTVRILWPLGLVGWGNYWTLLAWCEKRGAYRNFRLDRLESITVLSAVYPQHSERNLEHYLTQIVGIADDQKPR